MKTASKILVALLIISGLMPLMVCIFGSINQTMLMHMFRISADLTPDFEKTLIIMGAMAICPMLLHFIAAGWIWKGKQEGYTLALWISFLLIFAAGYMLASAAYHNIHDPSLFAFDAGKGAIIGALTLYALKK